jgi:hypothetical protein
MIYAKVNERYVTERCPGLSLYIKRPYMKEPVCLVHFNRREHYHEKEKDLIAAEELKNNVFDLLEPDTYNPTSVLFQMKPKLEQFEKNEIRGWYITVTVCYYDDEPINDKPKLHPMGNCYSIGQSHTCSHIFDKPLGNIRKRAFANIDSMTDLLKVILTENKMYPYP